MVFRERKTEAERRAKIGGHRDEWGDEICDSLLDKRIDIGNNEDMVHLTGGDPATIETKEIMK